MIVNKVGLLSLLGHKQKVFCCNRFFSTANFRRKRFKYELNHSPALKLQVETSDLVAHADSFFSLYKLASTYIVEHAARRTDLFFYCLIGCYKIKHLPERGKTVLQHGVGREVTEACHSSFFPSLIIRQKGKVDQQLFNAHFNDCLNSTIELPAQVNRLDEQLESRLKGREKLLKVLHSVCRGRRTPVEGMCLYFKIMHQMLNRLEAEALSKKGDVEAEQYLIELVRNGTFAGHWNHSEKTVSDKYIAMILRINNDNMLTNGFIYDSLFKIQTELLEGQNDYLPKQFKKR